MAHASTALMSSRTKLFKEIAYDDWPSAPRSRMSERLYFPLETTRVLTPFRSRVLTYIYRTAIGLSAGKVESARISLASAPDEEDSLHLDLTLTVNVGWDAIEDLRHKTLARVSEWSKEWSEEDQEDYGRWIYFGLIPSEL